MITFSGREENEDESGIDDYGKNCEENTKDSTQGVGATRMSEAHRNKDDIEDTCDISIFNRVSDRRKVKENDNNGSNKSDENWEVAYDLNSKKELSKQVDEVSQVLERSIPIKVVLPPTKEENSRCKGRNLLFDQRIVKKFKSMKSNFMLPYIFSQL